MSLFALASAQLQVMSESKMSLDPLLSAPGVVQLHAFAAMAAIAWGGIQLLLPKGNFRHRMMGYGWAALMLLIASSSLFIHTIRSWGPFSAIHFLSIFVLAIMPLAAWRARRGLMKGHRRTMISIFVFALIVAGFFTFAPGRIMHAVLFGS